MPSPDFFMSKGDSGIILRRILQDAAGVAVDLSGATVEFHLSPINGSGTPTIDAAAVNENATATGQVSYTFATALGTAGVYIGEFEVTFGGGAVQTFPNGGYIYVFVSEEVA